MYVIGETGILEELDLKGIEHMGGPEDADKVVTLKKGEFMEHDPDVRLGGGISHKEFSAFLPFEQSLMPSCASGGCLLVVC